MYTSDERQILAEELAEAFLAGEWRAPLLAERGAGCLDRWPSWLNAVSFAALALGLGPAPPLRRRLELIRLIETFLSDHVAAVGDQQPPRVIRLTAGVAAAADAAQPDRPGAALAGSQVAVIGSVVELAQLVELSLGQLGWLADVRGLERRVDSERLRNYRYRWVPRRSGLPRLLEIPKGRLKEIQRWLLHQILDEIPAHDAAHGFRPGRSAVTHASEHTGQGIVLRLDLRDFFASVPAGRVYAIFRAAGYGRAVAHVLTGLCTNVVPQSVWHSGAGDPDLLFQNENALQASELVQARFRFGRALATPHLPQGAPSSPALANLAAYGLDRRLTALAGGFRLRYSRYADDLAFSGERLNHERRAVVLGLVGRIARDEGFRLHAGKTAIYTRAQRQLVTGVVVNARTNVARGDYDRLRATLHRLSTDPSSLGSGSEAVRRRAELLGRVAWVSSLHPGRGAKLRGLADAIDWPEV